MEGNQENPNAKKSFILNAILLLFILVLVAASYYFYNKYRQTVSKLQNPSEITQEEIKNLVDKVGRLIELPKDETPTIATVSDINQLRGQEFFKNAKNGDKVLIYSKAKKAILYRPSINKIIEVGPVNIEPTKAPSPTKIKVSPTEELVPSLSPTVASPSANPASN